MCSTVVGKGRLAVFGGSPATFWYDLNKTVYAGVPQQLGDGQRKSDWVPLLCNVLRWLGKYSYGIYVYHHALKPVWIHFLWDGWITRIFGTGWPATLCYTAVATAASLILAWLSWTFFEGPILSLKSKFSYGSRKAPVSEAKPSSLS